MKTVLIIDDMATDRQLATQVVTAAGAQVLTASDGESGLAKARERKPDLILLDVVMPKMDGFQTCRKLKQDPLTAGIPVLLLTSKAADSDRFWGKRQGASDLLAKPYQPVDLRTMLGRYL